MSFQNYIDRLLIQENYLKQLAFSFVFFFPLKIHMACRAQGDCPLLVLVQK